MQRLVLTIAAALILLSTLVIPKVAHADGPWYPPTCPPNTVCMP
jgi:hypothetical protein